MNEHKQLVDAYLAHARECFRDGDKDPYFDAWEQVHDMVGDRPEEGWTLILQLIERAADEQVLAYIAAGPLEDLIKWHGPQFIERIEAHASIDAKFRRALRGVWPSEGPENDVVRGGSTWSRTSRHCERTAG